MSDGITEARRYSSGVRVGGVYRHFKGGTYVVLACTLDSEHPSFKKYNKVMYMNLDNGKIYDRLRDGDNGFLTPKIIDGQEVERFTLIGTAEVTLEESGRYRVTRTF